jgi:hypothetical protein
VTQSTPIGIVAISMSQVPTSPNPACNTPVVA